VIAVLPVSADTTVPVDIHDLDYDRFLEEVHSFEFCRRCERTRRDRAQPSRQGLPRDPSGRRRSPPRDLLRMSRLVVARAEDGTLEARVAY
jgi:hypothetical protein